MKSFKTKKLPHDWNQRWGEVVSNAPMCSLLWDEHQWWAAGCGVGGGGVTM